MTQKLYKKYAPYYDRLYEKLDHEKEANFIKWAVERHKLCENNDLLDVACGTGRHIQLLKDDFNITGLDLNQNMLQIAQEKIPRVQFIQGDMQKLDLDQKFGIILCMFSAMNYNKTRDEFFLTLNNFYEHLLRGGVLIFDMGLNQDNWIEGMVSVDTVVDDDLKLARISQSHLDGENFKASFIFLVKDKDKLDFDIDEHQLGVFSVEKIRNLMETVGFKTFLYDEFTPQEWLAPNGGRPVFVGVKKD